MPQTVEPTVNLSFSLPLSQAERVLVFVKSLDATGLRDEVPKIESKPAEEINTPAVPMEFSPVFLSQGQHRLKYLLDGQADLQQVVRFIVQKCGRFYNDELAAELGINDSRLTFSRLGHITRKLRKAGIRADGFRGTNWYSKIPSADRTMVLVREDVLPVLAEALEN
jgi:hypothetical protein